MSFNHRLKILENKISVIIEANRPVYTINCEIIEGQIVFKYDKKYDKETKIFYNLEELKNNYNLDKKGLFVILRIIKSRDEIEIYRKNDS
jgi:hypothetical protein